MMEVAPDFVASAEDFLLRVRTALPCYLERQPAIHRIDDDVRPPIFCRKIIADMETIVDAIFLVDFAG